MIAVCTTCDRIEAMTACPCGGIVAQLPGWVRVYAGYYKLTNATPPLAMIDLIPTPVGTRWRVTVCGTALAASYPIAAVAFQAVMAELTALQQRIDAALVDFLVANSQADETRDTTAAR